MQEFSKYRERGAYHWQSYFKPVLKSDPRFRARYDISLSILKRHFQNRANLVGVDIGCGDGLLLYRLSQMSLRAIGLDLEQEGLVLAQRELTRRTVSPPMLMLGSCYQTPLPDNSLDYAVSLELIEHLDAPEDFLKEVQRLLKPGGIFICTTPHRLTTADVVKDKFHVHEFMGSELHSLMQPYFRNVTVQGFIPAWLDKLYTKPTNIPPLDKGIRFLLRLVSSVYNPYTSLMSKNAESAACQALVAIASK